MVISEGLREGEKEGGLSISGERWERGGLKQFLCVGEDENFFLFVKKF